MAAEAFNDRVDHRTAFSGVGVSEEQLVLLSKGGGPDRVFDQVVVDFNERILKVNLQRLPLIQRMVDGFAHGIWGWKRHPVANARADRASRLPIHRLFGAAREADVVRDGPSGHQKPSRERSARILLISGLRLVLLYPVRSLRYGRIR
jgi:hypothetical protein